MLQLWYVLGCAQFNIAAVPWAGCVVSIFECPRFPAQITLESYDRVVLVGKECLLQVRGVMRPVAHWPDRVVE